MKSAFKEHYQYHEREKQKIWDEAYFVFDTNVLLNLYAYTAKTRDFFIATLKKLSKDKRLFMPYQVGKEFFDNRLGKISEQSKAYDKQKESIDSLRAIIDDMRISGKRHSFINEDEIHETLIKGVENAERIIETTKKGHPNWYQNDEILDNLTTIFKDSVGSEPKDKELCALHEEGDKRYKDKTPPGYEDTKKDGANRYGDFIIWKQIIAFAKDKKRPIIFVTADEKEDWWLKSGGKKIMPRPELKKEMSKEAGVDFHIYTDERFINYYKDGTQNSTKKAVLKEIQILKESLRSFSQEEIQALQEGIIRNYDQREIEVLQESVRRNLDQFQVAAMHTLTKAELHDMIDHAYSLAQHIANEYIPHSRHPELNDSIVNLYDSLRHCRANSSLDSKREDHRYSPLLNEELVKLRYSTSFIMDYFEFHKDFQKRTIRKRQLMKKIKELDATLEVIIYHNKKLRNDSR